MATKGYHATAAASFLAGMAVPKGSCDFALSATRNAMLQGGPA